MACNGNEGLKTLAVVVSGMSCNHCKRAVEEAVAAVDGINQASVELETGMLTVVYDPQKVDFTKVQDAVVRSGYEARQE
ncbi:MAG: cation transporter [Thermacetogeniaceae bacterium]